MLFDNTLTQEIIMKIEQGAASRMSDRQFVARELERWMSCPERKMMVTGEKYYTGDHDILQKKRTAIGEGGKVEKLDNLPNNRIVDNQYRKAVKQKKNYLLGKPFTIKTEDEQYSELLRQIFDDRFMRMIGSLGKDAMNNGIAWLYPYYDQTGKLTFKRFVPSGLKPYWTDLEHTQLDGAIRVYDVFSYEGSYEKIIHKVEVYDETGISYFEYNSGSLVPCDPWHLPYMVVTGNNGPQALNWTKIPLVAFKYNEEETPLITMVKSLQDGLNEIESSFKDNMDEDERNTIIVLVNYDGQDLGEFRHNLATYGAVKVRSTDGASGDVKTLQVQVNAENYKAIIQIFKKAIIENAMGYDAKDDRLGGNANQMNIQSIYNDIDLDANDMEAQFRESMAQLIWFVDCHLANTGQGDFSNVPVEIKFNKDMMMNKGEAIDNCTKSSGLLSSRTVLANHPFVTDVDAELEAIEEEKQKNVEMFGFGMTAPSDDEEESE